MLTTINNAAGILSFAIIYCVIMLLCEWGEVDTKNPIIEYIADILFAFFTVYICIFPFLWLSLNLLAN